MAKKPKTEVPAEEIEETVVPPASEEEEEQPEETVEEPTDDVEEEAEETDKEKDASFYKAEAERLAIEKADAEKQRDEEIAERKRQNDIKDRALEKEKEKRKKAEEAGTIDPEQIKREAVDEVEQRLVLRDCKKIINELTNDPSAKQVFTHHCETTFKHIEDPDERVNAAISFANRNRARQLLEQGADNADDDAISSLSGGNARGSSGDKITRSRVHQAASGLVSKEARKYLKKYVS